MATTPNVGLPLTPDSVKISDLAGANRGLALSVDTVLGGGITSEMQATAAAAAVDAVNIEINTVDLVRGSDRRVLRNILAGAYAIPFTDEVGHVAGGVQIDGVFNFERPPRVEGSANVTLSPINDHATGWAIPLADQAGHVAGGVRPDGTVEFFKLKATEQFAAAVANQMAGFTRSARDRIACIGDSLTNGYFDGTGGHTADAYPAQLATLLGTGPSVFNISTSGWTVDEEALRIGAMPLPLSATTGTIPASGPVTVTTTAQIGWGTGGTRTYAGTLAGVPGSLVRNADAAFTFTFTRTTPGAEVPLPSGTVYVPDYAGHAGDTAVVMLGRNDISNGITGPHSSVAEHVFEGIRLIVDWLTPDVKHVLIMPPTTNTLELSGTAGYIMAVDIAARITAAWPSRTLDLRGYLVNQAIHDLGITPTTEDLANMAGDTLPPSIMDPGATGTGDITHYSRATAALVAAQVHNYLTTRDWA